MPQFPKHHVAEFFFPSTPRTPFFRSLQADDILLLLLLVINDRAKDETEFDVKSGRACYLLTKCLLSSNFLILVHRVPFSFSFLFKVSALQSFDFQLFIPRA